MTPFRYDDSQFVLDLSPVGRRMTVKLPTIRRRNLEDSLNLPYDSLKLNFRTTPPSSSSSPRFRFSLSSGIPPANGTSSSKRSEGSTSLPEANPAGQQFLVQDAPPAPSEARPPSQETRRNGPRPPPASSRLAPAPADLAGINVFQLELRQPPPPPPPPPPPATNGGGATRPSGGAIGPARQGAPAAAANAAPSAAIPLPGRSSRRAALTNSSGGSASEVGNAASLGNSLKATPDGDTDTASIGSYSGSLPPRLPGNNGRLNGASCAAPLHLSATHMTVASRKPSRQLPLPAASKPSDPKFCYPDPLAGASNSFHQRLAEMAALEADTVRWERARLFRRKPRFGRQD